MTTLSIELPPEVYERLRRIAGTRGTSAEDLAQVWLAEKTAAEPASETMRERMRVALRAHGLLAEITDEEKRLAAESTLTLDEARAIHLAGTGRARPINALNVLRFYQDCSGGGSIEEDNRRHQRTGASALHREYPGDVTGPTACSSG